jgi:hypothetical protein
VTIQRHFKGWKIRKNVALLKFTQKRLVRKLEPIVLKYLKKKQIRAAIIV